MSELHRFALVEGSDPGQLLDALAERHGLERDREVVIARTLVDTFDWRLHAADTTLEHRRQAGQPPELVWRASSSGELLGSIPVDDVPRFAWELPAGPVVGRIADVVEMRALLELVSVDTTRSTLRLVDDEGKTTARVVLDRSAWSGRPLPSAIEVLPVRGYDAEARQLGEILGAQVVLVPHATDQLHTAAAAAGLDPGSYSSKLNLALDPGSTAHEAWMQVLRALLATMLTNERGLRDDLDSEFLHDYRVAVRRTRSVLGQAKGILAPDLLAHFRAELGWLGAATGSTRDFDVYLLSLPAFEDAIPSQRRADLKPFRAFLEQRQREAHAGLVEQLDTPRYASFVDAWRSVLDEAAVPDPVHAPDASAPAHEIAADRTWRAYRRLTKAGRAITDASAPERLHDLRKDAKRLRYLIECFGSLLAADGSARFVRDLKGLQDVLGEFQDTEVQAGSIEGFGEEMLERGGTPASALLAMGAVVERLDDRRALARGRFAERFAAFDTRAVRRRARSLFGPAPAAGASG